MIKIIIIDNYDSFTYNLVHMVKEMAHHQLDVMRNDEIDYVKIDASSHIILSPGPGIPDEAGELKKVIKMYSESKKILGVCLGHQAIGEVYGARLNNLAHVFHGRRSKMIQTKKSGPLFNNVEATFYAGRYHSWAIDKESNTSAFDITVVDESDEIMAVQHKSLPVFGVQFHPESIMTEQGKVIVQNFIEL
jgi:anthranilate synthase component II